MASTLSWQGRCGGNPINVADTMASWGLSAYYDAADPNTALYASIIKSANPDKGSAYYAEATATPQGLQGNGPSTADTGAGWEIFTEMCLRARMVVWAESKIGDCGSAPSISSTGVGTDIGLAYSFGLQGASLGASIAGTTLGAVLGTVGSAAIPAIGALLTPIIQAFQQHAKNVAAEQETLCQLTNAATQAIQQIYQAVESGTATPAQGYASMQALYAGFQAAGKGVTKTFCDGGCGLNATMLAHVNFSAVAFGLVAPPAGTSVETSLPTASQSGVSALDTVLSSVLSPSQVMTPGTTVSEPLGIPVWAWVAAAILVLFLLTGGTK